MSHKRVRTKEVKKRRARLKRAARLKKLKVPAHAQHRF